MKEKDLASASKPKKNQLNFSGSLIRKLRLFLFSLLGGWDGLPVFEVFNRFQVFKETVERLLVSFFEAGKRG